MGESLAPPLCGDWVVLNPPGHPPHAFDLVGVDRATASLATSSWRFLAGLLTVEAAHGWGRPVLAPQDGKVVVVERDIPDHRRLVPIVHVPAMLLRNAVWHGLSQLAGNHVLLSTSVGYVLLAHLQQRSVTVGVGEQVRQGQLLGQVGNSGNTMAPHLHIQVTDTPDPLSDGTVPFRLTRHQELVRGRFIDLVNAPLPRRPRRVRFAD